MEINETTAIIPYLKRDYYLKNLLFNLMGIFIINFIVASFVAYSRGYILNSMANLGWVLGFSFPVYFITVVPPNIFGLLYYLIKKRCLRLNNFMWITFVLYSLLSYSFYNKGAEKIMVPQIPVDSLTIPSHLYSLLTSSDTNFTVPFDDFISDMKNQQNAARLYQTLKKRKLVEWGKVNSEYFVSELKYNSVMITEPLQIALCDIDIAHTYLSKNWQGFTVTHEQFIEDMLNDDNISRLYYNLDPQVNFLQYGITEVMFISKFWALLSQKGFTKVYMDQLIKHSDSIVANPNNANAFFRRAIVKELLSDVKGAKDDLDISISLNPTNPLPYLERAYIYSRSNQYDKAIRDIDIYIKCYPNNPHAYLFRGRLKAEKAIRINTSTNSAYLDFRKALDLGSEEAYNYISNYILGH